jgi:hypothetical protein
MASKFGHRDLKNFTMQPHVIRLFCNQGFVEGKGAIAGGERRRHTDEAFQGCASRSLWGMVPLELLVPHRGDGTTRHSHWQWNDGPALSVVIVSLTMLRLNSVDDHEYGDTPF